MPDPPDSYHFTTDILSGATSIRGPGRGMVHRLAVIELTVSVPAAIDALAARVGLTPVAQPDGPGAWLRGAQGAYPLGALLLRLRQAERS